ncbi:MAG: PSD1 and planctomycete cytochrome C domain-containing protein [Planctomycetales bacterium]
MRLLLCKLFRNSWVARLGATAEPYSAQQSLLIVCCLILFVFATPLHAADPGLEFFEKKIRPLLADHCYKCHSAASKKTEGGLSLDSRAALMKGGDNGPALVPGKPAESLLIKAVKYADEGLQMPPTGKLPEAAIKDLEQWIALGAPDPRGEVKPQPVVSWADTFKSRSTWWSLQPVKAPKVPESPNAPTLSPIDRFLDAKLQATGLTPAANADPRTLIRRLSLVLTGLPPTTAEVQAFLTDYSAADPHANPHPGVERLVDRLLNSPHFGERWARHWMDVVRFSETHGNEWNYEVHHAWKYRDYLIRAFNADVPYDQLVREHLAGDLLTEPRWNKQEQFNESVIGTSFYRFGEVNHDDCISLRSLGYDILDNQIDTLSKTFQATTVACARCHDHKMDAVSTKDYYALLGVLRSSRMVSHTLDAPTVNEPLIARMTGLRHAVRDELAKHWLSETDKIAAYLQAAQAKLASPESKPPEALDPKRLGSWVAALKQEKAPPENSLEPWRTLHRRPKEQAWDVAWKTLAAQQTKEAQDRATFNAQNFELMADFRKELPGNWKPEGQGLRHGTTTSGDLALAFTGDSILQSILPAGAFTNATSDKLNGTLRSTVLTNKKKHLSFQVMGLRSSALRLVSNNCQLNYKNYRALISPELHWITFSPPEDRESLRTYAELMTMFDNPKFPDQLSALGGDKANYKLPWEKAAENPRSWFGITRAVWHDQPEPPKAELDHLRPLFEGAPVQDASELAGRYARVTRAAVERFATGKPTDSDVTWLQQLLTAGLLPNDVSASPRLKDLVQEYRDCDAKLSLPRVSAGLGEFGPGYDQPVLVRGDCYRPGEVTHRGYLEVLANGKPLDVGPGSGRLALAQRIASPTNPLTARVYVNRVWHHLFGAGLVRSVDDFGHVGELPSHPELLDYLASQFVKQGWSTKQLIRAIVLTHAFQQDHTLSSASREKDPQNRWLSHYPARRLEAEGIRDAILTASGRLDGTLYGMSVYPYREKENSDRRLFPGPLDGSGRRSLYIKNTLMEGPKFLNAFNFPGGKVTTGRRESTNVPSQALALLNDPFVMQQAEVWGAQLARDTQSSPEQKLNGMFERALNRPPHPEEIQEFNALLKQLADFHGVQEAQLASNSAVWKDVAHTIFNLTEFIYIP